MVNDMSGAPNPANPKLFNDTSLVEHPHIPGAFISLVQKFENDQSHGAIEIIRRCLVHEHENRTATLEDLLQLVRIIDV